jgi:hypothetical protein
MKRIRELCAATTLLFVLSLSASAGDIHTNVVDPPPPPPASATAATTEGIQGATDYETSIAEIALSVLQLLSVG